MFALIGLWAWVEPAAVDRARSSLEPVSARWAALETLFDTVAAVSRVFPDNAGALELAALAGMYLLCVGLITACFRVAASRA